MVVVADAARYRQTREGLDDSQRIDAVDVGALAVSRSEAEEIIIGAFMLISEDQLRLIRRRHDTLIFEAEVGTRIAIIGRGPADEIIVAVVAQPGHRRAAGEAPVEQAEVQPGVADILVELRDVGAVGGGAEEAVIIEVRVDVITAQVEAQRIAERDLQSGISGEILVSVLLGADRRRRDAVGAKIGAANSARNCARSARHVGFGVERVAISIIGRGARGKAIGRRRGCQADDAADRLAAMDHRVRTAQHLDPADVAGQQMAEIIGIADAARIIHFHTVDQDQSLRRLGAPQRYAGDRSGAAGPAEPHSGHCREQVDHIDCLALFDRGGIDDRDRLTDLVARLLDARRGHDNLVAGALAVGGFGKRGRRRRQSQQGNGRKFQHGKPPNADNEGGACRYAARDRPALASQVA